MCRCGESNVWIPRNWGIIRTEAGYYEARVSRHHRTLENYGRYENSCREKYYYTCVVVLTNFHSLIELIFKGAWVKPCGGSTRKYVNFDDDNFVVRETWVFLSSFVRYLHELQSNRRNSHVLHIHDSIYLFSKCHHHNNFERYYLILFWVTEKTNSLYCVQIQVVIIIFAPVRLKRRLDIINYHNS